MGQGAKKAGCLLAALAAILAGCGSEPEESRALSESEYQDAILEIVRDSADANSLYTDLVVKSRPTELCAELISSFHEEVADLVGTATALDPPPEVAAPHRDFVAAAERSVERVGQVEAKVRAGDLSCGDELNDALYRMPSSGRAEEAISRLEEQGYVVFGR